MNPPINRFWVLSFQGLAFLLLLLLLGFFHLHPVNLVTADLGRHIKNGEIFLKQGIIVADNHYFYTETDRPVINHHWGAGVVFYILWKLFDFSGLSIFYTALALTAFCLFFSTAQKYAGFWLTYGCSVLSLPLLVSRLELRPEGFSYLFLGVYVFILYLYQAKRLSFRVTAVFLSLVQIIWVNTHIFFFLGPFLVGVYLLETRLQKHDAHQFKKSVFLLVLILASCLINPFGLQGLLSPLTIFKEYGYMLAENQSVWFMQKRFPQNPLYLHFEIVFLVLIVGMILTVRRENWRNFLGKIVLMGFFSLLAWKAIRGLVLFGLFFIPHASSFYAAWFKRLKVNQQVILKTFLVIVSLVVVIAGLVSRNFYYSPVPFSLSALRHLNQRHGLIPGIQGSAEFFKRNSLQGPIFNNYDIGGYLIFHLFPEHKVFVDNRPEAYSVSFFKDIYIPMQEDETIWQHMLKQYQFNVIYFYRLDMTPWAQPFLIRRLQDPDWAPVFVDDFTLILLRRNQLNDTINRRYELPASMFQIAR